MANTINVSKIMDGPSHVTVHCFMQSDGIEGEVSNFVLVDPSTLDPSLPAMQDFILKQIWYEISGFTVTFAFGKESGDNWPFWTLTPGASLKHDWRFFGGLRDQADAPMGISATGNLLMSTTGFTDATDSGAFVLWLEKRNRPNPQS
jgi:hypothetical protein